MDSRDQTAEPTATSRTRSDLIRAAIECWSEDSGASLGEIATAAGVGRSTLNRHFAGRAELVSAVDLECRRRFVEAAERARPEEGSGLSALSRLCAEIVGLGPVLGLIFADNAVVDPDTWAEDAADAGPEEDPVARQVGRGLADGSLAADLPAEWIATWVWTSLFAAWLSIKAGGMTQHEAAALCTRTLARGVADAQ